MNSRVEKNRGEWAPMRSRYSRVLAMLWKTSRLLNCSRKAEMRTSALTWFVVVRGSRRLQPSRGLIDLIAAKSMPPNVRDLRHFPVAQLGNGANLAHSAACSLPLSDQSSLGRVAIGESHELPRTT